MASKLYKDPRKKQEQKASASSAYADYVNRWTQQNPVAAQELQQFMIYPTQSDQNLQNAANHLLNNTMATPQQPDIFRYDAKATKQGIIDQSMIEDIYRRTGYFDKNEYLFDGTGQYRHLVSPEYIGTVIWELERDIEAQKERNRKAMENDKANHARASELRALGVNNDPYHLMSYEEMLDYGMDEDQRLGVVQNWLDAYNLVPGQYGAPATVEDLWALETLEEQDEWLEKLHKNWNELDWWKLGYTAEDSGTDSMMAQLAIAQEAYASSSKLRELEMMADNAHPEEQAWEAAAKQRGKKVNDLYKIATAGDDSAVLHSMTFRELMAEAGDDPETVKGVMQDWLDAYNLSKGAEGSSYKTVDQIIAIQDEAEAERIIQALEDNWANQTYYHDYEKDPDALKLAQIAADQEEQLAILRKTVEGAGMLNPTEEQRYFALLAEDPALAEEYLQMVSPQLLQRQADADAVFLEMLARDSRTAIPAFWLRNATNFAAGIFAPVTAVGTATGLMSNDPNSWTYALNRTAETISKVERQQAAELLNVEVGGHNLGEFLYDGLTGLGDFALSVIGGGTGGQMLGLGGQGVQKLSAALMGSQAASSTLYESAQRGLDPREGALLAVMAYGIEYLTEKFSIEAFFADPENAAKYMWQNMLTEGSEEIDSEVLMLAADHLTAWIFEHETQIRERYDEMRAANQNMTEAEAQRELLMGVMDDIMMAGAQGTFMGAVLGGGNAAADYASKSSTGRAINRAGNTQALLDMSADMPEYSKSREIARGIKKNGGKMSPAKLGQLYRALQGDVSEGFRDAVREVTELAVGEQLAMRQKEYGNADNAGYSVQQIAQGITSILEGEEISRGLRSVIEHSRSAWEIVSEMQSGASEFATGVNIARAAIEKTYGDQMRKIAEMTGKASLRTAEEVKKTAADKADAEAERLSKDSAEGMGNREMTYQAEDGTEATGEILRMETKDGQVQLVVKDGEGESTVSYDAIKQLSAGTAQAVAYVQSHARELSTQAANAMLAAVEARGGDAKAVVNEFMSAYDEGYYAASAKVAGAAKVSDTVGGAAEEVADGIERTVQEIARRQGLMDAKAAEAARTAGMAARQAGTGVVSWLGEVKSNAEVTGRGAAEALSEAMEGMTEAQRATVEGIQAIAQAAKIDVVLFESAGEAIGSIQNGSYDAASNVLYLDINSGANTETGVQEGKQRGVLGYAMLRTMSHELTHYIERNTKGGYNQLRDAMREQMEKAGANWAELVRDKISVLNLDRAAAEAEVVADAAEFMLENSALVKQLDTSLKAKVKGFVQDFLQRIRNAFRQLTGHRESRALRKEIDGVMQYVGDLQQIWDVALEEATGGYQIEEAPAKIEIEGLDGLEAPAQGTASAQDIFNAWNEAPAVDAEADAALETEEAAEEIEIEGLEELKNLAIPVRQFQAREPVELREDGLLAVHNIKQNELISTLEMGGFPMPSIAVIKAKDGHNMYGEYSVIFGRDTIDPGKNKANKVYGADAWTPVFPRLETEINSSAMFEAEEAVEASAKKVDEEYGRRARTFFGNFGGTDSTTMTMEDIAEKAWGNPGMLAAFLTDQGETVEVLEKEVDEERPYKVNRAEQYNNILEILDLNDYFNMPMHELLDTYGDRLAEASGQMARLNSYWKRGDRKAGVAMARVLQEAIAYEGAGRDVSEKKTKVKDYSATHSAMEDRIDRDEFNKWIIDTLGGALGAKGIYNGKDRFTSSGNRRSFKQTHYEVTAENVVKSMLTQEESNIPVTDAKGLMAAASRMYKSIAEIKADSARLGKISVEEYDAKITAANVLHHDLLNAVEAWDYDQIEDVGALLVQAAKKRMSASEISALLKRNGYTKATMNAARMAEKLIKTVQNIPSGYFEAKPARVVAFDEIKMVVAPDTMPDSLANALTARGIPYTVYDGTDGDRIAKMNEVEEVQFSVRDADVSYDALTKKPDMALTKHPDIRYSQRDLPEAVSIREYIGGLEETARMSETEKTLLKRYKENLRTLEEKQKAIEEQDAIIAKGKEQGDEYVKAVNRREIYRKQASRAERALMAAERNEGFARVMYESQQVVNEYLSGRTAGSVADAADLLETQVRGLTGHLAKVEADLTRAYEGQRAAFARGLFRQTELNAAAKQLKESWNTKLTTKEIANRLALAYSEIYANDNAEGAARFVDAAKELAADILRTSGYRYRSETLSALADRMDAISLTEADKQEIKNAGITLTAYKRMLSPYVKVTENGTDLDVHLSNAEYYGDGELAAILKRDAGANLAMSLYETISAERAKEAENRLEGQSEAESLMEVLASVTELNLPMSTSDTTLNYIRSEMLKAAKGSADAAARIDEAINTAKSTTKRADNVWRAAAREAMTARRAMEYYRKLDEQRRLTELKEQKEALTAQLRSDNAAKLEQKVQKYREEFRSREAKAREYRSTRDEVMKLRRQIGREVKRLNTLRVRETDAKHVPDELQPLVDAVMQTFTESSLATLAFPAGKAASLSRTYRILQEMESDAVSAWDDEVQVMLDNLEALSEQYRAIKDREDGGAPSIFSLEGAQLEREILTNVQDIVSNVWRMVDGQNKAFIEGRKETAEQFFGLAGQEMAKRKDRRLLKGKLGDALSIMDDWFVKGNMTPIYYIEHLNNPYIQQVFDEIRRGVSEAAMIEAEGKAFVQEQKAKYNYGKWAGDKKLTFKTAQGHQIELTREQAMWAYATAKREKSNKLYQTEHLSVGGFQYKDLANVGEGKYRQTDKPHQLKDADIAVIEGWLTDEQKAYADALVGFLSTRMAEYGNAASMSMFGYRKFMEQYYFPFRTSSEQRFLKGDEGAKGENAMTGRVKNSGFTKKLMHKANQTLVMDDFTTVVSSHIQQMAVYSSMVEPIENLKRLLNHKVVADDGTTNTIRALIGQKEGEPAQDYMDGLLKDLNGAVMSDRRASQGADKLIGAFKRGAVMASASVVLQQPTAITRAMAYVSPKHFVQNPFFRPGKGTWEKMMKYAGTAVIKDMGKFDIGMGMTAAQYIEDEHLGVFKAYQRARNEGRGKALSAGSKAFLDWLTAAPGKADQWTWSLIWNAVENEQAAAHPEMDRRSEAFLRMCGRRFDDVIDHTQVYDSVITKSNLMRSQSQLHKMATSFMSEPTLSFNMLWDAVTGKHGMKKRAAIIGGVMVSQALAGAMAALVQAFNDDDDERNWLEKYADRASRNIFDNINVFGMIPYISDIMSLFEGYEVERPDMSVLKDIVDYGKSFFKKAADPEQTLTWKDYENFVGTICNLTGIPAKNVLRELRRTKNAIFNTDWNAPNMTNVYYAVEENTAWGADKNSEYYDRMANAYINGDKQLMEDLHTYMLTSKMVTEEKIREGMKSAIQARYVAGDVSDEAAMAFLTENGVEADDAYWTVDKWEYMRDTGMVASTYRKYDDFFQAVESGENLRAVIKEYTDNGVSTQTLAGQITTQYKQRLINLKAAGDMRELADLQAHILSAYEALGYDREKKLKDVRAWYE